jgi:hypothetical protein
MAPVITRRCGSRWIDKRDHAREVHKRKNLASFLCLKMSSDDQMSAAESVASFILT